MKKNNSWHKLNSFLENRLRITSYGQKVVLILIALFVVSFMLVNIIFTYIDLEKEKRNVLTALERSVSTKAHILRKELEDIEDNGKILISNFRRGNSNLDYSVFKRFKIYGIYIKSTNKFLGRKVPVNSETINTKFKYVLFNNFIVINFANNYYIFVKKKYIKDILDPQKSFVPEYKPLFMLEKQIKDYRSLLCSHQRIKNGNFFITGCVEESLIIHDQIIKSIFENVTIFSAFFILAVLMYNTIFRNILLYPVHRLRKDIEKMYKEGLEKTKFTLHKFGRDEFAHISKVLEDTRVKILKHQKGMYLVLQTTSKMISMTNDIHRFSLFTVNRLDELIDAEGTVLCLFSKIENRCVFNIHSDKYLNGSVPVQIEKREFVKLARIPEKNKILKVKDADRYIVSIKKDVNDEYSLFVTIFKKMQPVSQEDLSYIDMILSHLVYSINLLNLATYDPLTKLYNRRAVVQFAEKEVERSKRYNRKFSIILIDIDDFKAINDTYGHTIGDIVLKSLSNLLKNEVREVDKIGRYGGEEFIIILPETKVEDAVKLANRIKRKTSAFHFEINSYSLSITVSAGVAGLKTHGETFEEILQAADLALYEAKRKGKNQVVMLDRDKIEQILKEEFRSKNFLDRAIKEDRVIPFFQPIIDLETMEVVGYEILARIIDKDRVIPANKFITTSIKFGIILKIDEIIQRKTVEFLSKQKKIPQMLFFNLSRPYIQDVQHIINFVELLEKEGIPKENVILEITEEEAISEITVVKEAIRIAKSKGIRFALDDFGVGYSTFSYIKHFNIDIIKLDGSLVKNIDKDIDNQIIVGGIAYICERKGIKLLAEMVETEEELETLKYLGVSYAQGYLFGKATPNI